VSYFKSKLIYCQVSYGTDEAINEPLLIIISLSVSLEAMFVGRLFVKGKLTVA